MRVPHEDGFEGSGLAVAEGATVAEGVGLASPVEVGSGAVVSNGGLDVGVSVGPGEPAEHAEIRILTMRLTTLGVAVRGRTFLRVTGLSPFFLPGLSHRSLKWNRGATGFCGWKPGFATGSQGGAREQARVGGNRHG